MRRDPPPPAGRGGIYVHVPFCSSRCSYCDFLSLTGFGESMGPYLEALEREILRRDSDLPPGPDTLYLGGGTPSLLPPEAVRSIIDCARTRFGLQDSAEITLEANPDDVDGERLDRWAEAGINRISIGVQSLDDAVLSAAGRRHDGEEALRALREARRSAIPLVNADLILGLPGERPERWSGTVGRVASAAPDHISVYLLETDKETPLADSIRRGGVNPVSDDLLVEAWNDTGTVLEGFGYSRYEISNYCRSGRESRHNLKYWTDLPYEGFGLGAHGYVGGARRSNTGELDAYLEALRNDGDPVLEIDRWDPARRIEEALFMGLRLKRGIDLGDLGGRYGIDLWQAYRAVIDRTEGTGLLSRERERIRLTEEGTIRSNEVFREIIGHLKGGQS